MYECSKVRKKITTIISTFSILPFLQNKKGCHDMYKIWFKESNVIVSDDVNREIKLILPIHILYLGQDIQITLIYHRGL